MRRTMIGVFLVLVVAAPAAPAASADAGPEAAPAACAVEIPIPGGPPPGVTIRKGLDIGADGVVWFTQLELDQIVSYTPTTEQFDFFDIGPNAGPHSVAVDQVTGSVWWTEIFGHRIGVLDPETGDVQTFSPPTPNSEPYGIDVAPDGEVWITQMDIPAIGRFVPSTEQWTEYPLPDPGDVAENVAVDDASGDVWITEGQAGKLARLDPDTGVITDVRVPGSVLHSLDVDAAGRVWFSDIGNNAIGAFDPSIPRLRSFPIPTPSSTPHGVLVDSRGLFIWFTELNANRVSVLDPVRNRFLELRVPTPGSKPYFVAQQPDGEIWFSEGEAPNLGRLPCTVP